MSDRIKASIEFKMPEEWLDSQHPVGKAIQGLYTELAKAYQLDRARGGSQWSEWDEIYEEED